MTTTDPYIDRLLDGFQQAVTGRDRAAFADVCALDVHYEDPLTDAPLRGIDALAEHCAQLWTAAPGAVAVTSGTRLSDGRFAVAPLRLHGAHVGSLGASLPATKRRFDIQVLLYCELDPKRERLWRVRAFYDAYTLAVQLGILPARGGVGEKAMMVLRGFGVRARNARPGVSGP